MARRAPLRRLTVDGLDYRWKVEHAHHVLPPAAPGDRREGRCAEVFLAVLEGRGGAPLRVRFSDGDDRHAGYPSAGVVWTPGPPPLEANLNLPSTARRLIELGRAAGWRPEQPGGGLEVGDGFAWLPALAAVRSRPRGARPARARSTPR